LIPLAAEENHIQQQLQLSSRPCVVDKHTFGQVCMIAVKVIVQHALFVDTVPVVALVSCA
jgi:hypothetical protein